MLGTNGNFNTEIRENGRQIVAELIFKDNVLNNRRILTISYSAETNKALGGIVREVLNASLIDTGDLKPLSLGDGFYYKLYTATGSCVIGMFYISRIKRNEKRQTVDIESVDIIEHLRNSVNKPLPFMRNVTTHDYFREIARHLSLTSSIEKDVLSHNLEFAYPTGSHFVTTLEDLGVSMQSLIRIRPTYSSKLQTTIPFSLGGVSAYNTNSIPAEIPFYLEDLLYNNKTYILAKTFKTSPTYHDIIKYEDLLLDFSVDDDLTTTYKDVVVSLYYPSTGDLKRACEVGLTIPANYPNYTTGKISYEKGVIPQLFSFDGKVTIEDYFLYDDGCRLTFNNSDLLTKQYKMTLDGYGLQDTLLTEETDSNNVKVIVNKYIQSPVAYDLRIYKNKSCTISYRGNPAYEVGDTLLVDGKKVLVTGHTLEYTGALKGTLKGVLMSE